MRACSVRAGGTGGQGYRSVMIGTLVSHLSSANWFLELGADSLSWKPNTDSSCWGCKVSGQSGIGRWVWSPIDQFPPHLWAQSQRLRRKNFPCCIPVLLSGLWESMQETGCQAYWPCTHFNCPLTVTETPENTAHQPRRPDGCTALAIAPGIKYEETYNHPRGTSVLGAGGSFLHCTRKRWSTGSPPAPLQLSEPLTRALRLHHWARNLHYSFQHHSSWKPWLLHSPEIIHQTFPFVEVTLWKLP